MIGWYEPSAQRFRAACDGPEMRDFRILLQVSFDRLYAACTGPEVGASDPSYSNHHCNQAAAGASPPRLVPLGDGGSYQPKVGESEFDYVMRLLAEYQFPFEDVAGDSTDVRCPGGLSVRHR